METKDDFSQTDVPADNALLQTDWWELPRLGFKEWRDLGPSGAEDITYLPARFSLKSFLPVVVQPRGGLIHC